MIIRNYQGARTAVRLHKQKNERAPSPGGDILSALGDCKQLYQSNHFPDKFE